jgi:DNA-binding response OmpR family regulator
MQTILLIETDKQLLEQYRRKLKTCFTVYAVNRAQQAIDILDGGSVVVDAIVMDINIDTNNGIEVLHEIRSYDDWVDIPIVILSSIPGNALDTERLSRYGVKKFLYKPHTLPKDLLREVSRMFVA